VKPFDQTPITLSLNCGLCALQAEVVFADDGRADRQSAIAATWACPRCYWANGLPAVGRVVSVQTVLV
jgi:hypothetical protein